ncbi:MAG: (2Fe-2S)-binding protein [Alphaproteobacteria bacterium]
MREIRAAENALVKLTLNGKPVQGRAEPRLLASDFLRHVLAARGTHVGCEHGVCGACTILVDGRPTRSCMLFAVQLEGASVETVESLADDATLNDLQDAFSRHHALQCGFCTAGILMSATEFLRRTPEPDENSVREMLSGHLCRCTGYDGMVKAILEVALTRRRPEPVPTA